MKEWRNERMKSVKKERLEKEDRVLVVEKCENELTNKRGKFEERRRQVWNYSSNSHFSTFFESEIGCTKSTSSLSHIQNGQLQ